MTDGSAWMAEGMRHAQLVGTLNVPYVCRAGLLDHVHLEIGREAGKTYRPRSTGVGSGHERGEHHHRRTRRADKLKHLHDASQEPIGSPDRSMRPRRKVQVLGQLAEKKTQAVRKKTIDAPQSVIQRRRGRAVRRVRDLRDEHRRRGRRERQPEADQEPVRVQRVRPCAWEGRKEGKARGRKEERAARTARR